MLTLSVITSLNVKQFDELFYDLMGKMDVYKLQARIQVMTKRGEIIATRWMEY